MKQEIVTVSCDLCGKPEAQPIRFGLDDKAYVIDLDKGCRTKLVNGLAPFTTKATNVTKVEQLTRKRKLQNQSRHAKAKAKQGASE